MTDDQFAALVGQTVEAMLGAIPDAAKNNQEVCLAAIGGIAGSVITVSDKPEQSLMGVIAIIRGIMDGSLLDD